MGKLKNKTIAEEPIAKPSNEPTKAPSPPAVTSSHVPLSPGAQFAQDEGYRGSLLKFVQGVFLTADEREIPLGTRVLANMAGAERGWIRFNGEGEPPEQIVGNISGGFSLPHRDTLGFHDKTAWPKGLDGKESDPWKRVVYLPMIVVTEGSDEGELFTFTCMADTARRAVLKTYWQWERLSWKYRGQLPIVELGCKTLPNDFATKVPLFTIVGWQPMGGEGAPVPDAPPLSGDLNDAIPC